MRDCHSVQAEKWDLFKRTVCHPVYSDEALFPFHNLKSQNLNRRTDEESKDKNKSAQNSSVWGV